MAVVVPGPTVQAATDSYAAEHNFAAETDYLTGMKLDIDMIAYCPRNHSPVSSVIENVKEADTAVFLLVTSVSG